MNNKNINEFLKDTILDKFLVNFVPGLILYYVIAFSLNIGVGDGLISLVIITSVSWTLGMLLEMVLFRRAFNRRKLEGAQSVDSLHLLFGKMGVSILIACLFSIDLEWLHDLADNNEREDMAEAKIFIKLVLFCTGGILLYLIYRKQANKP